MSRKVISANPGLSFPTVCIMSIAEYTSNVVNLFYGFIFTVLLDGPVFAFNTTSPPVYPHYVFISPENRLWAKFFVS